MKEERRDKKRKDYDIARRKVELGVHKTILPVVQKTLSSTLIRASKNHTESETLVNICCLYH
jgi:hypothetical protein